MKDTFVLKTIIKEFDSIKDCFSKEKIESDDLIITNKFISLSVKPTTFRWWDVSHTSFNINESIIFLKLYAYRKI